MLCSVSTAPFPCAAAPADRVPPPIEPAAAECRHVKGLVAGDEPEAVLEPLVDPAVRIAIGRGRHLAAVPRVPVGERLQCQGFVGCTGQPWGQLGRAQGQRSRGLFCSLLRIGKAAAEHAQQSGGRLVERIRPRQAERAAAEQRSEDRAAGAHVDPCFVELREQLCAGLCPLAQAGTAGRARLSFDSRLEKGTCGQGARCASTRGVARSPGRDRGRGRAHVHCYRTAGVLGRELAELPLPAQQPKRVVQSRLEPGGWVARDRLGFEPCPSRRLEQERDLELGLERVLTKALRHAHGPVSLR